MTVAALPTLEVPPAAQARLRQLEALVRRWTVRINLVAPSTLPDLWARHILDSAQLWDLAPGEAETWADLGSGGGFPGLVIAALTAERGGRPRVTLVESDRRKAAFLRTAVRELALPATVLDERAEVVPSLRAAVVSARALAPLPSLLSLVARHLAPGGVALLPKGSSAEAELDAARAAGWRFVSEAIPSRTDPAARVLRIRDLAHG